jgi:hypothetical protein
MAQRLGLAGIAEASDDIFQPRWRKRLGQPQQDAVRRVLDDELVPGGQRWASRTDFGRITCPFEESWVFSMDGSLR